MTARALVLAALLLLALGALAGREYWSMPTRLVPAIEAVAADHGLTGGVIAEGQAGEPPRVTAFGNRVDAPDMPIGPADRLRIASLSKPVTAAAVIAAARERGIALDTPLQAALPELGQARDPRMRRITLAQLLRHSGGWDRDIDADPFFLGKAERASIFGVGGRGRPPRDCTEVAEASLARPLQFAPGSRYAYSNLGYCWLGRWLETVTGSSYAAAVDALVPEARAFTLDATKLDVPPVIAGEAAQWPVMDPAAVAPAGGWIADAAAYFRFASRPIDPEQASRPSYAPRGQYYGYGWRFWELDGTRYRTHFGAMPGAFSVVIVRGDGRTLVALFAAAPADYDAAFVDLFESARAAPEW